MTKHNSIFCRVASRTMAISGLTLLAGGVLIDSPVIVVAAAGAAGAASLGFFAKSMKNSFKKPDVNKPPIVRSRTCSRG